MWLSDLQLGLVNGLHQAGGNVERGEFGEPPIVVAIAEGGADDEFLAVGRPIVFVDVSVGGRELAELARREIDDGETLLVEGVLDFAGGMLLGNERASGFGHILGEENGDGFCVGGPGGGLQKAFDARELARGAACGGRDVELELATLFGVREKRDLFAVGGPGDAAFGMDGVMLAGCDAMRRGSGVEFGNKNGSVASGRAGFGDDGLDPGDALSIGRDGGLFKAAGAEDRAHRVVGGAGCRLLRGFEAGLHMFGLRGRS